jgi:hypothetical protein
MSQEEPTTMSQRNVESVIGRLVTDEAFRRRFLENPLEVLGEVIENGLDLNECERRALASMDQRALQRFAAALDARIQKCAPHKVTS